MSHSAAALIFSDRSIYFALDDFLGCLVEVFDLFKPLVFILLPVIIL
jgi:hypothetical protein